MAEAASGLRHMNGFPGGPPPRLALSLGDSLARMFAAQGALAALYRRTSPARGRWSTRPLTEACLAVQESTIPDYDVGGVVRGPSGTRLEGIAPSNIYRTADGSWVVIAANQDTVFRRLCARDGATRARHRRPVRRPRRARPQPGRAGQDHRRPGRAATAPRHHRNPQRRRDQRTDQHRCRGGARSRSCGRAGCWSSTTTSGSVVTCGAPVVIPVLSGDPGGVRNAGRLGPPAQRRGVRRPAGLGADEIADLETRGCCERTARTRHDPRGRAARRIADRDPDPVGGQTRTAGRDRGSPACARSRPPRSSRRRRCPRWPTRRFSAQLGAYPDIEFSALVASPNGARRAIAAGLHSLEYVVSAADGHSNANVAAAARRPPRRSPRSSRSPTTPG